MIFNFFYISFLIIASPFYLFSIIRRDKHRIGLGQKFGISIPTFSDKEKIWIHAVSVGEVLLCRPLIAELQKEKPNLEVILSVTTATGYRMAMRHFSTCQIIFYPFDFTWAVKRMIKAVNPKLILLVELELWPNFIAAAKKLKIPVAVINGRLSQRSCDGFKKADFLLKSMFDGVDNYWMQTELYTDRVKNLGVSEKKIKTLGSIKYDCLDFTPKFDKINSITKGLANFKKRIVIVAGSTHNPEEEYLLDGLDDLINDKKITIIIVPRHPERYDEVANIIKSKGLLCQRKTKLDNGETYQDNAVIMLDTMGELAQVYGISDVVYIGGTLIEHGGQNLMEPAALGKPIICGPSVYNFQETYDLLKDAGATIDIKNAQELKEEFTERLLKRNLCEIGKNGVDTMRKQSGSTKKHMQEILKVLN